VANHVFSSDYIGKVTDVKKFFGMSRGWARVIAVRAILNIFLSPFGKLAIRGAIRRSSRNVCGSC
jgi:hypothetical protein